MEKLAAEELKGKQCVPALVHHNIEEFQNLQRYEVLPMEGLHTIAGHIKNIYQEIQYHLDKDEKLTFIRAMEASFAGKEAKRACDYRLSLVEISKMAIEKNLFKKYHRLFLSLVEIQEIFYTAEYNRTPKKILRLFNLTFMHIMEMKKFFSKPKHLTIRKLHGQYYHALTVHAAQ